VTPLRAIDGSGQLGMDERVVDDKDLSDLLEKRLRLLDDKAEITKSFKAAHEEAKDAIAKLDLEEGGGSQGWSLPDLQAPGRASQRVLRGRGHQPADHRALGVAA
jgi:hypothetical protein